MDNRVFKKYKNLILMVLIALSTSILSLIVFSYFFQKPVINYYSGNDFKLVSESRKIDREGYSDLVKTVNNSVVFIQTIRSSKENAKTIESGSGVILTSNGFIVTNLHVIKDHKNILVTTSENVQYEAELVGADEQTDIAVLKISEDNLPFLFIGNSNAIEAGDIVLAFGNPFRFRNSASLGIVSAKYRTLSILGSEGTESYIQTDALANSGNSGGALVNTSGKLIGLIAAVNEDKEKMSGFSFAIPANMVKKVFFDIINYKAVQKARAGMNLGDVPLSGDHKYFKGTFIHRLEKNGPADKAGLRSGDIIMKFNSIVIENTSHFQSLIYEKKPGDTIGLEYLSGEAVQKAALILKNAFNTNELITNRKDKILTDLGLVLRELTSEESKSLKSDGVIVVSVTRGSKAGISNMEPDYIITEINSDPVKNVDDIIQKIEKSENKLKFNGFYKNYPGNFPYVIEK